MSLLDLDGKFCTDSVNVHEDVDDLISDNRLAIIPRLNFTCSGRIINIRARVNRNGEKSNYPVFQVWRQSSANSMTYNMTNEVQLQSNGQVTRSGNSRIASIILTGTSRILVQSGDVVGYYHPPDARYRVITRRTDGYILYQFRGSHDLIDLDNIENDDQHQPLIQFTIGECYVA